MKTKIKKDELTEMIDTALENDTPCVTTAVIADETAPEGPVTPRALRVEIRKIIHALLKEENASNEGPEGQETRTDNREKNTLQTIAQEFGLSISGAKQLIDKTLAKTVKISKAYEEDDELELEVLRAIKEYIEYLQSSEELTQSDVQLLYSHPDIIRGLDGFREFLSKRVKRFLKANEEETSTETV